MKNLSLSRREFLRNASLALPLSTVAPLALATAPEAQAKPQLAAPARNYFNKGTRLTISMWDFSWLHASHPGGVYEMDFKGSTLSNYAEPLFSLWQDLDWHWISNTYFLAAKQ